MRDYFGVSPRYDEYSFERRFRMPRAIFEKLHHDLKGTSILVQEFHALGKPGIYPLQRIVAVVRVNGYVVATDALDEYLKMGEDYLLLSRKEFFRAVIDKYACDCLNEPREEDLMRILSINAGRGFPCCFGSIDSQHWELKNCQLIWRGSSR